MSPFPQWTAGDTGVANQGGSSVIVTKDSEHPEEAAEFVKWLNASDEGADLLLNVQNAYPAATAGQESAVDNAPPSLMPEQTDYYSLAATIASNTISVTWGPNVNVAESAFTDELQKAIANGTPWRDAFIAVQNTVVRDMTDVGFDITNKN
jgi:multiple sugar transport system substrate-binding protein